MTKLRIGALLRTRRERLMLGIGAVIVAAVLVAGGVILYRTSHQGKQVTAYFTETIGVYPGSTVRVLGVPANAAASVCRLLPSWTVLIWLISCPNPVNAWVTS